MSQSITISLDEACEFIVDCLHKTAPFQDQGYPMIRTPNIGKGRLILDGVFRVSQETYETWTQRAVPEPGDLILAREAPAGNVALVTEGEKVCLGQRTVHLRPKNGIVDGGYLCNLLLTPEYQGKILAGETGATAKHVNLKDIRRLKLENLPRVEVQRRIADVLSAYDDLIENNRRRMALLEESARQLYQEWFVRLRFPGHEHTRITNGVPEGWERRSLGECFTLKRGHDLPETHRVPGDIPVVSSSGITGYHNTKKADGPGVVTGRYGTLGDVYYVEQAYWPHNTALYVVDFKGNSPLVVYHFLKHALQNAQSNNAAVPGLNRNVIHTFKVIWPSARFRDRFDEFLQPLFEQIGKLRLFNENLRAARDLLLPQLMSGEVAV